MGDRNGKKSSFNSVGIFSYLCWRVQNLAMIIHFLELDVLDHFSCQLLLHIFFLNWLMELDSIWFLTLKMAEKYFKKPLSLFVKNSGNFSWKFKSCPRWGIYFHVYLHIYKLFSLLCISFIFSFIFQDKDDFYKIQRLYFHNCLNYILNF